MHNWLEFHLRQSYINFSSPGQNGHHFVDDVHRCIFVNKDLCILIRISLEYVPKGPIDNKPALV